MLIHNENKFYISNNPQWQKGKTGFIIKEEILLRG